MDEKKWNAFCTFRGEFKKHIATWEQQYANILRPLQESMAESYEVETSIVYNKVLDDITEQSDIKLIIVGDNPGKEEQKKENCKYFVGNAGKAAENFFCKRMDYDFRKNVIILNKTPIHTAITNDLKYLQKLGGEEIRYIQQWMATETAKLHIALGCKLWIVGYRELKPKGIFSDYYNEIKMAYKQGDSYIAEWNNVFVYRHFSRNCFLNDYNKNFQKTLQKTLETLGYGYRDRIFGENPIE
jgi:hypothetical protein